jgi:hypothetical protein
MLLAITTKKTYLASDEQRQDDAWRW